MEIKEALNKAVDFFKKHQISQPRLDAEVLLAHLMGMERIQLYVNYDLPLQEDELKGYRQLIVKRVSPLPVAYLTGEKEFMSLALKVNPAVLIPRPETELLVETVINFCQEQGLKEPNIVDIGTGSGAIAVSLAYYLAGARVLGIDISRKALAVARENICSYQLEERVKVIQGDLLGPLLKLQKNNVDVIVANPPYIRATAMASLPPDVKKEPKEALWGGDDGLFFYKKLEQQVAQVLKPTGLLALEIGDDQAESVRCLFNQQLGPARLLKDYAGKNRIILFERKQQVVS